MTEEQKRIETAALWDTTMHFTQYNECETPSFWGGTLKYLIDLGYNSLSTCTICFYCSVVRIDQRLDKDVVLKYYATNNTISTALRLY